MQGVDQPLAHTEMPSNEKHPVDVPAAQVFQVAPVLIFIVGRHHDQRHALAAQLIGNGPEQGGEVRIGKEELLGLPEQEGH